MSEEQKAPLPQTPLNPPEPPKPGNAYRIPPAGSLGLLALGAVGITEWRKVRNKATGQPDYELPEPKEYKRPKRKLFNRHPHVNRRKRTAKKVLIIGWDAADWKVISPMVDAGMMPNLAKFIDEGVIGNLATLDPPLSPMLWTSIATGKTADKHGVLGFTQPDPEQGRIRPVLGSTRKGKALWNILNQEGFRSHVIGWWPSHPAEPVNGVYVSNFYHKAVAELGKDWPMMDGTVHPPELADTLAALRVHPAELTGAHILPFVPRAAEVELIEDDTKPELVEGELAEAAVTEPVEVEPAEADAKPKKKRTSKKETERKRLGSVGKIIAEAASVHAAATWVMENEPWDFMAVYYDAIDHFGHGFMKFNPPKQEQVPEDLYERYKGITEAGYRYHDMLLGRLLTLAGPETTVILISDHGFHPDHLRPRGIPKEPAGPAIEHRKLGIFAMRGPGVRKDDRIYGASLLDIAPTVLTMYGLPVGKDMDGHVLVNSFEKLPEPDFVPTWEEIEGAAATLPQAGESDPWMENSIMDQLVELGYIDPPGKNAQKAIDNSVNESRYYLARVYASTGRSHLALPILEELYEKAPDQRRYALRLAQVYREMDRLPDCRKVIEDIVAREERRYPSLDLLEGTLLMAEDKPEEALIYLQRAEKSDPRRPDLHQRIGSVYLQLKQWDMAENAFRRALEIDPESSTAWHGLARAYLNSERYEDAADAALTSVGLIYFQPVVHFHLGEALRHLGMFERAAEAYGVAVNQAPGMRRAHRRLVQLYEKRLDQPELAEQHRQFLESDEA